LANLTFSCTTLNYTSFDRAQLKESNGAILFCGNVVGVCIVAAPTERGPRVASVAADISNNSPIVSIPKRNNH
jgi:hypothetical protein